MNYYKYKRQSPQKLLMHYHHYSLYIYEILVQGKFYMNCDTINRCQ